MATNKVTNGKHLEMDGTELSIFGNKGYVSGKSWVMNLFAGAFIQVSPGPSSPEIEGVIDSDIADGNFNKIHHVRVNPNVALRLYLEGRLTREDVKAAESTETTVTFKAVKFNTVNGEKTFDVIVDPESEHTCATIDENGEVV